MVLLTVDVVGEEDGSEELVEALRYREFCPEIDLPHAVHHLVHHCTVAGLDQPDSKLSDVFAAFVICHGTHRIEHCINGGRGPIFQS